MAYRVILFPEEEYSGGPLPSNSVGRTLRKIRIDYPRYYKKMSVLFRMLKHDKTRILFQDFKRQGKISVLTGVVSGDSLYEAKEPIRRTTGGGVLRVYFCLSRNKDPQELVVLDAEYKTGAPNYSTAISRLSEYRRSDV